MVLKSLLSPVFIAPATMAALPAVNILLRIGYPIASASAAIFIAIQVALGIGLGLLCHRLPHTQRAILTGLMAWLIWQGEWEGIRTWCAASSAEYSVDVRLVFSVAMIGGILVVYGIVSALKQNAALVAAAFAGVSLIGTLAFVGFDQGEIATRPDIESQLDSSLAPFVFIVLDEHAGIGGLPPDHPDTPQVAARLRETYRDFANHEKAYSRYTDTRISVPAMMNGHTGDDHPVTTPSSTGWPIGDTLLYRQLRERGYQIRTYSSGYPDLCEPKVTACRRVSNWHMSLLERSEVSLLAKIEQLVRRLGMSFGIKFVQQYGPVASIDLVDRMVSDIRAGSRGRAFIVHLLLPHHPYILGANCAITERTLGDPPNWDTLRAARFTPEQRVVAYRDYLNQVLCSDSQVRRLFAALRETGTFDDATIIVVGDHGARLSLSPFRDLAHDAVSDADAVDVFSALAVIKKPGLAAGANDQAVAVQDLIATEVLGFDPVEPLFTSGYFLISPENESPPLFREIRLPRSVLEPGEDR